MYTFSDPKVMNTCIRPSRGAFKLDLIISFMNKGKITDTVPVMTPLKTLHTKSTYTLSIVIKHDEIITSKLAQIKCIRLYVLFKFMNKI